MQNISISISGVFNDGGPYDAYIDVKRVSTLNVIETSAATLDIGGGVTLHDVIKTVEKTANNDKDFFYGQEIGAHLRKVSNTHFQRVSM